jgi:hypothetical protein
MENPDIRAKFFNLRSRRTSMNGKERQRGRKSRGERTPEKDGEVDGNTTREADEESSGRKNN